MSSTNSSIAALRRDALSHWRKNGRHALPWRKTTDPYKILVAEVMLQQTQVSRVTEKYKDFLKAFPTIRALAKAPLRDVLKVWSGMGYNRRAKFLRDAARLIVDKHGGKVPRDYLSLRALPGIGDYTARAVRAFAFNEPDVFIETNIRAALIHHFGGDVLILSDRILSVHAGRAAKQMDPREWHWALMDYGAHLKKIHLNPARRSAHYVKQSKFEGSNRQVRGAILKLLNRRPYGDLGLSHELPFSGKRIRQALRGLALDGLVISSRGSWRIA